MNKYDVSVEECDLFFCPIKTRVPLKFGIETTTHVVSARAFTTISSNDGTTSQGVGETPLSVAWVWPGSLAYSYRLEQLEKFCVLIRDAWRECSYSGHPMEIGHKFMQNQLKTLWESYNETVKEDLQMPWLAALVCNSLFDISLYDAYGNLHKVGVWETLSGAYMNQDLSSYYTDEYKEIFTDRYPSDYILSKEEAPSALEAWHLVGAKDILEESTYSGEIVKDGYPFFLKDWIETDGLKCLKVKLTGLDSVWDYARLTEVGKIAIENGVVWLTADFNCTVTDVSYVCDILDRLVLEYPRIYQMILYIEQPFPYEIFEHPIDVHAVSARKPLFMDESAHEWQQVAFGRELGWTGVALKTCKTFTGALLSMCWAKAHSMTLMVQDLTNPMLAQIPHVELASRCETIMGVETNAMQFYPEVSSNEMRVHPGLYKRVNGKVNLDTIGPCGFGYRLDEIEMKMKDLGVESLWKKVE
jgi:L-alanine-DL-glutamate epimerase-like enolase superfamily enzyme